MAPPRIVAPTWSPSPLGIPARSRGPVDHPGVLGWVGRGRNRPPGVHRRARLAASHGALAGVTAQPVEIHPSLQRRQICFAWLGLDTPSGLSGWSTTDLWTWSTAPAHRVHPNMWCTAPITCCHVPACPVSTQSTSGQPCTFCSKAPQIPVNQPTVCSSSKELQICPDFNRLGHCSFQK